MNTKTGYFPLQGVSPTGTVGPNMSIRKECLMDRAHSGARREVSHQPLSPHSNLKINTTCLGQPANLLEIVEQEGVGMLHPGVRQKSRPTPIGAACTGPIVLASHEDKSEKQFQKMSVGQ